MKQVKYNFPKIGLTLVKFPSKDSDNVILLVQQEPKRCKQSSDDLNKSTTDNTRF